MNLEIAIWLSGDRDFDSGLSLYHKYASGTDKNILKVLQGKRNPYSAGKLAWELEKLMETTEILLVNRITIIREEATPVPPEATFPGIMFSPEASEVFVELEEKRKVLYKEAAFLHQSALWEDKSEKERGSAAARIIEIMEKLLPEIWVVIDHIKETGKLPYVYGKQVEVKLDFDHEGKSVVWMVNRRATLRTYLSRDKDNPLKAEKVAIWTREIEAINKTIGHE